ncbi:cystinosin [Cryptococcus neoformans c45]|nr:cystinosin [Cryptococcus neoformans var. grubii c45]
MHLAAFLVNLTGVTYFIAWSYSFYIQLILNFKRKTTQGLSPDFVWVNPLGFLALTLWNWGAYFSPVARKQYQDRHHGHLPQVSTSDLAFSLHALIVSTITLAQVFWYGYLRQLLSRQDPSAQSSDETSPLISDSIPNSAAGDDSDSSNPVIFHSPIRPSPVAQLFLGGIVISPFAYAIFVWTGKAQFLDWLYLVGNIKVVVSAVKYIPQVVLNHRMRAVNGFAIGVIICDIIGSVLSFSQLVISSVFIDHDPSGIIANPAKLGLAGLSFTFDLIFIAQKYWLYRTKKDDDERI